MAPHFTYVKQLFIDSNKKKHEKCEMARINMLSCLRNPLDKTNCLDLIELYYLKCKSKSIQKK